MTTRWQLLVRTWSRAATNANIQCSHSHSGFSFNTPFRCKEENVKSSVIKEESVKIDIRKEESVKNNIIKEDSEKKYGACIWPVQGCGIVLARPLEVALGLVKPLV